jgi:hypothetical protein
LLYDIALVKSDAAVYGCEAVSAAVSLIALRCAA